MFASGSPGASTELLRSHRAIAELDAAEEGNVMSGPFEVRDPQLAAAVESALGSGPPFARAEVEAFAGALRVDGARDLTGLDAFASLTELHLVRCASPPVGTLAALSHLRELWVEATPLADVADVAALPSLRRITLRFTSVGDPAALLGLALEHLELTGCPIAESWWDTHLGAVVCGPAPRTVVVPPPHHRYTNDTLAKHGFGVTIGFGEDRTWLVHPGPDAVAMSAPDILLQDGIGFALQGGHTAGREYIDFLVEHNDQGPVAYDPAAMVLPYEVALVDGALAWIDEAGLSDRDAFELRDFVRRFAALGFHRYPGGTDHPTLAEGWALLQGVLAGTVPDVYVEHCLDSGTLISQPYIYDGRWWHVRRMCVSDDQLRAQLADEGLLAVAEDERSRTILFVRGDAPEGPVYLLSQEDPITSPSTDAVPAYRSLASALAATRALRLPDGTTIEARDD